MRGIVTVVLSLAVVVAATSPLQRLVEQTRPAVRLSDVGDDDLDFISRIARDYPEIFEEGRPGVSHEPDNRPRWSYDDDERPHWNIGDNGHHREDYDEVEFPVSPITRLPAGWRLFSKSFSQKGYFNYVTVGRQMPIYVHYSASRNALVVNHTSTYHYFPGSYLTPSNQSAIAVNSAFATGGSSWAAFRQNRFGGVAEWERYYNESLRTDNVERKVGDWTVVNRFGSTPDHHVARHRRASVTLRQIVKPRQLAGLPESWEFGLAFPCSVQEFHWFFTDFWLGEPDPDFFLAPSFMGGNTTAGHPYGNIQGLTAWENFPGNFNCQVVPVPFVP